jgi:hypothetical protein
MYIFPLPQTAGTVVHIESESGEDVLAYVPAKEYQSVLVSSPEFENGSTYVLYSGGASNGAVSDGLHFGEVYTAGTQTTSFTITGMVTGNSAGMGDFRGGRRP